MSRTFRKTKLSEEFSNFEGYMKRERGRPEVRIERVYPSQESVDALVKRTLDEKLSEAREWPYTWMSRTEAEKHIRARASVVKIIKHLVPQEQMNLRYAVRFWDRSSRDGAFGETSRNKFFKRLAKKNQRMRDREYCVKSLRDPDFSDERSCATRRDSKKYIWTVW